MAENYPNYHIYIHQTKEIIRKKVIVHQVTGKPGGTPTDPSSPGEGGGGGFSVPSQIPGSGIANTVIRMSKSGVTASGVIALAVAVVKATEQAQKTVGKLAEQTASASGDYSWSIWWNNLANEQHNLFHPFSAWIGAQQTEASWARANKKVDEQRTLLGDAALNTLTKGV